MPILNTVAKVAMKPMPRMITPKAHSILDFLIAGAFFSSAAWFWNRNKRVATASLMCGATNLAVSLLTDYLGGLKRGISFRAHRDIDFGLAAMTATMPEFFGFKDESEKIFFLAQGAVITAIAQLTDAPRKPERVERDIRHSKVA